MPEAPAPVSEQPTADQASSSPGSLGRYRLLQCVGEGGMGEVPAAALVRSISAREGKP